MSHKTIEHLTRIIKSKNSIFVTTDSEKYLKDTEDLLDNYKDDFGNYLSIAMTKNHYLFGISRYQRKAIEKGGKIYLLTI